MPAELRRVSFHVYILRCGDGSYYVGHSDELERRLAEHAAGECAGYAAARRPVQLVWSEYFETRDEACAAERRIKGWSRRKNEALIAGEFDGLKQAAKKKDWAAHKARGARDNPH